MNVYDFDKTIYDGDSTVDFWKWCLKHYPATRRDLLIQGIHGIGFGLRIMEKTKFKQSFYRFLKRIPDIQSALTAFWSEHRSKIKKWYLDTQREDDVIISASPEFLLEPVCKALGIRHMMASRVDPKTGVYEGVNCHGEEKIHRFREFYQDSQIECFFSDSHSDDPMAGISPKAIWVNGDNLTPWKFK